MNKLIFGGVVFLMLIVTMSSALAELDIDVDCKDGRWDSHLCKDSELDDEFDLVEDAVNGNTDMIISNEDRTVRRFNKVINGIQVSWTGIKENKNDINDLENQGVVQKGDINYFYSNENKYLEKDGVGVGMSTVVKYLYDEYFSFLKTVFVKKGTVEDDARRTDLLIAKVNYFDEWLNDGVDFSHDALKITVMRTGVDECLSDGFCCKPNYQRKRADCSE